MSSYSNQSSVIYDRKQLDKAYTFGVLSLSGILVPLIGFIFIIISFVIRSGVEESTEKISRRKDSLGAMLIISLLLAFLSTGFWAYTYLQRQAKIEADNKAATQLIQRQESAEALEQRRRQEFETYQQEQLQICLENIDEIIVDALAEAPRVTNEDAQVVLDLRKQLRSECEAKFN